MSFSFSNLRLDARGHVNAVQMSDTFSVGDVVYWDWRWYNLAGVNLEGEPGWHGTYEEFLAKWIYVSNLRIDARGHVREVEVVKNYVGYWRNLLGLPLGAGHDVYEVIWNLRIDARGHIREVEWGFEGGVWYPLAPAA